MSKRILAAGLILLVFAVAAEVSFRFLPNKVTEIIHKSVIDHIVWQKDAPASVNRRYESDTHKGDPPDYVRFYFLNVTNVKDVRNGDKPKLQEVGPYTYKKNHIKLDVVFNDYEGTVRFKDYFYHHFVPEMSGGSQDDPITTLNIPLIGVLEGINAKAPRSASPYIQILINLLERWGDKRVQGLFTTRTAGELLWGYEDPLLSRLSHILPIHINPWFGLVPNASSPEAVGPEWENVVDTGRRNISNIWNFVSFHGMQEVNCWQPPHIEYVRGTDAFQFRPGLKKGDELAVWIGEAFRSARLIEGWGPGAENTKVGHVPVFRYRPDPTQRDIDPRYYQYVVGLMNVSAPMAIQAGLDPGAGPPLFLSLPGYCYADEALAEGVEGITCNKEIHDIYLDIEPTTGITLRALKSVMISSWFGSRYKRIEPHVKDTFLPIFWAQEGSQAAPRQLRQFNTLLLAQGLVRVVERWGRQVAISCITGGVSLLFVAAILSRRPGVWREDDDDGSEAGEDTTSQLQQSLLHEDGDVEHGSAAVEETVSN